MASSTPGTTEQRRDILLGGRFKIGQKIGRGAFGAIYRGIDLLTLQKVAVKLEPARTKQPQLEYEARVYDVLSNSVGIPEIHWYGTEIDYNIMVIELLGPSLEQLLAYCGGRFSLKTVLMLADQLLRRVEYLHSKGLLHRDLKPENFLVGAGQKSNCIYLIDFGLAKRYRDSKGKHIPYREDKNLTGTARYASVYTHLGIEQSRRDDLEALGYSLLYFLSGQLPWQGLQAADKQSKYSLITEKKLQTSVESLCKGHPVEFATYINYAKAMRFIDQPDYSFLRSMFRDLFIREGYQFDSVFDWNLKHQAELTSESVPRSIPEAAAAAAAATTLAAGGATTTCAEKPTTSTATDHATTSNPVSTESSSRHHTSGASALTTFVKQIARFGPVGRKSFVVSDLSQSNSSSKSGDK